MSYRSRDLSRYSKPAGRRSWLETASGMARTTSRNRLSCAGATFPWERDRKFPLPATRCRKPRYALQDRKTTRQRQERIGGYLAPIAASRYPSVMVGRGTSMDRTGAVGCPSSAGVGPARARDGPGIPRAVACVAGWIKWRRVCGCARRGLVHGRGRVVRCRARWWPGSAANSDLV